MHTVSTPPIAPQLEKTCLHDGPAAVNVSPNDERQWLRAMIDQVPDYLFVKDIEGRFIIANAATAADLGREEADLVGKNDFELHSFDRAAAFFGAEQEVLRYGATKLNLEEYLILPSGEKRWLSTSKLPLRNETGQIVGLVGIARDVTARREADEAYKYLAFHDPLTGLPNRSQFNEHLAEALTSPPIGARSALHYIDLDGFKTINDTLGHPTGDELLKQVANRLVLVVGDVGTVARLGGDEFAIIQKDVVSDIDALTLSHQLLRSFGRPFRLQGELTDIGASIGLAIATADETPENMLRKADIALYEAKAKGSGQVKVFTHDMAVALLSKRAVEQELRKAVAQGDQFRLAYQPIFDATGLKVVGAEALIRWDHPVRGVLPPDQFIGVAEDRGLIGDIGAWVLDRACRDALQHGLPWVAVNVSPLQFRTSGLVDQVAQILLDTGLPASRLQIEITEGVLIEDSNTSNATLKRLRAMGVKLALDDFGTGYSSMNYLRRYPVDKLKIDRSFVEELGTSREADAILRTIVTLARAIRLTVTAEGVENEQQRQHLAAIGCHELQGFLFSKPLDIGALADLLAHTPEHR